MKKNIILAGVGGQGILSIAAIIDWAALQLGLNIKQAEVHGMSQRGGMVQSHLRISDETIYSDLIPFNCADLILSVEPMEALRYLPYLSETGRIITAVDAYQNIPNYPDINEVLREIKYSGNPILVDINTLICKVGNHKAGNMLMLGTVAPYLEIDSALLEKGIKTLFHKKGKVIVNSNLSAFQIGKEIGEKQLS